MSACIQGICDGFRWNWSYAGPVDKAYFWEMVAGAPVAALVSWCF